jgi:hypothetical protein
LASDSLIAQYGFLKRVLPSGTSDLPASPQVRSQWSGEEVIVTGDAEIEQVLKVQVDDWQHYVGEYKRA